jgi:hypothetical protein
MKKSELNAFVAKGEDSQQQFKQNIRSIDAQGKIVAEALGKKSAKTAPLTTILKILKPLVKGTTNACKEKPY